MTARIDLNKDKLIYYYQHRKYSSNKIGRLMGVSDVTVLRNLKLYGVKIVNRTRFKKGEGTQYKHGFYKTINDYKKEYPYCQICGWNETTCDIHHIIPLVNNGGQEITNLITLCPNCHRMVHKDLINEEILIAFKESD